jgi:hypothetical protein
VSTGKTAEKLTNDDRKTDKNMAKGGVAAELEMSANIQKWLLCFYSCFSEAAALSPYTLPHNNSRVSTFFVDSLESLPHLLCLKKACFEKIEGSDIFTTNPRKRQGLALSLNSCHTFFALNTL